MACLKIYTLSNGEKITAYALAKQLNFSVGAARARLTNTLDANKLFGTTESLFETITKVWVLDDGFKGTAKELAKKAGVETPSMIKRLKQSRDPKRVLKPKSIVDIGSTRYQLKTGVITAATYAEVFNKTVLEAHYILIVEASSVVYSLKKFYLSCGKEVTLHEVMSKTGVCHSVAKRRLEKSNSANVIFKKSSKVMKQVSNYVQLNKSKNNPIRTYRMSSCHKTGAIRLRTL
jgi:hypothetical protein